MPMWRCPHCQTPQAESSRCWVCRRSSTSCGTCRQFRRAIAGQLGYCGLDRNRLPLRGDEMRGCWEAGRAVTESPQPVGAAAGSADFGRSRLEFVPVGEARAAPPTDGPLPEQDVVPALPPPPRVAAPFDGSLGLWPED